ncbi:GNAT family N-acetyltransferase [Luteimicrobium sp. NPDC057192]|uniref:GNAT family N-acetyltransferase n=1 Tax=Luteimicrobium sp. NPDC057192 TaxID=3346042 RepID=UPI0036289FEC
MPSTRVRVLTTAEATDDDIASAARIWAEATARRDGLDTPAPWERQLAGIRARLAPPGAVLFLATGSHRPTGFGVAAPDAQRAELSYLAVDPRAWGQGTAAALLARVERWAVTLGAHELTLWVLDDNARAQGVYLRAGWTPTDERQHAQPSGRLERRLTRALHERPTPSRS